MKSDTGGCSTCEAGIEKYEVYFSEISRKYLMQYEYRTRDGKLYAKVLRVTTTEETLAKARAVCHFGD